jgi:hypothetical protein
VFHFTDVPRALCNLIMFVCNLEYYHTQYNSAYSHFETFCIIDSIKLKLYHCLLLCIIITLKTVTNYVHTLSNPSAL